MRRSRFFPLLVAVLTACGAMVVPAGTTAQVSLEVPEAIKDIQVAVEPTPVRPGRPFTLTLTFQVEPGLHLQAHRPLQAGFVGTTLTPPQVDGVSWGDAQYPPGQKKDYPGLGTLLEYSGQIIIRQSGTVAADAVPGQRSFDLALRYQACTDEGTCFLPKTIKIPATLTVAAGQSATAAGGGETGSADAAAELPAGGNPSATLGAGRAASAAEPATGPAGPVPPAGQLPWQPFSSQRLAELTAAGRTVLIDFTADWCPNCKLNELWALNTEATAQLVERNGVVPLLADFTEDDPEIRAWLEKFQSISVPLTVILPGSDPTKPILLRDTYRQATLLAALEQAGPSVVLAAAREPLTLQTTLAAVSLDGSIVWYLVAGLVGGFILNFMPCVLPVISIKVLSLVGQASQSRRRVLGLGLAFAAGMIVLFAVLGILVTVVGQTWGALFQSTAFLLVMLGILVAMAASLFGAFTLAVPGLVGDADAAIEGEGYAGSFGKGVLAVLLGTPCSGPFLGSAMAWAASQSAAGRPYLGMLVFLAMGVGMALPFVVLAAKPGWMRFIPRPGAWMETFKQLMAFLLLLTAVYILAILRADMVKWAVLFAFGVAFASWLYGRLVRPGRSISANWTGRAVAAVVVAAFAWISFTGARTMGEDRSGTKINKADAMAGWPSRSEWDGTSD